MLQGEWMPKKHKNRGSRVRVRLIQRKQSSFSRIILAVLLSISFIVIGLIFFNPLVWRLNLRSELEKSKIASTIYDRHGAAVATLYSKTRLWVAYDQIPQDLSKAFIATEDYRFFLHKGIDFWGIGRALYQDIRERRQAQGGSTITQQLVKNVFFSQEKKIYRKIWEMAYAIRIEQQYTKTQILEFYLNSIYLGHGAWGVQAASTVYFGKAVQKLKPWECALIAGLAKGPEYYSPYRHPDAALSRRNLVLRLMGQHGYLNIMAVKEYSRQPIRTLPEPGTTYVGAYFSDYVINVLERQTGYSERYLRSSGLKIYTTMARNIQVQAERAINILPEQRADRWGVIQPQGAIVVMDPKTGQLLALVGGRRYTTGEPNRAFQIFRQPGSAIKPFVYTTALESGFTPEQRMIDKPLEIMVNGKLWRPQNYDNKYRGPITLRTALEESVNTIAVQLVEKLGPSNVFQVAQRMGLTSLVSSGDLNDQSLAPLALGGLTKGVTLLELTGTYSSFANEGIYAKPYGINRVYDNRDRVIYRGKMDLNQVIQPETANTLTSLMEGVITRGTGVRANIGITAAGKTGTTNQNTNGWFIGYTGDLLAGVWIGNDQPNQPIIAGGAAMGSGMAAAIWGELMGRVAVRSASLHVNSPDK
jgi:penicillin-binding protein 1A